jgi:hypothetical protein
VLKVNDKEFGYVREYKNLGLILTKDNITIETIGKYNGKSSYLYIKEAIEFTIFRERDKMSSIRIRRF